MSLETAHGYLSPFHGYSGSYSDMQTWSNAHGFQLPPLIVSGLGSGPRNTPPPWAAQ